MLNSRISITRHTPPPSPSSRKINITHSPFSEDDEKKPLISEDDSRYLISESYGKSLTERSLSEGDLQIYAASCRKVEKEDTTVDRPALRASEPVAVNENGVAQQSGSRLSTAVARAGFALCVTGNIIATAWLAKPNETVHNVFTNANYVALNAVGVGMIFTGMVFRYLEDNTQRINLR